MKNTYTVILRATDGTMPGKSISEKITQKDIFIRTKCRPVRKRTKQDKLVFEMSSEEKREKLLNELKIIESLTAKAPSKRTPHIQLKDISKS